MVTDSTNVDLLREIVSALKRLAPQKSIKANLDDADAFIWDAEQLCLHPVFEVAHIDLTLLQGLDQAKRTLLQNTRRFAQGFAANNALLWGARGMGKSSLVKALHAEINKDVTPHLILIEIHREDLSTLPKLLAELRRSNRRCLLFCDDLSFDQDDTSYKSLKTILEGGLEGRPVNVLFYATSNRRHLMPRDMIENERSTAINPGEAVEEKVSLSDRFGLWIGFHQCPQELYLSIIEGYIRYYQLPVETIKWEAEALEWSVTRGSRSGRVAWQYLQDLAGRLGKSL